MDRSTPGDLGQAYLDGAAVGAELLRNDGVRRRWHEPSALPEMTVGALACHLSRQARRAAELLVAPTMLPVLASVDEHYERAAWGHVRLARGSG